MLPDYNRQFQKLNPQLQGEILLMNPTLTYDQRQDVREQMQKRFDAQRRGDFLALLGLLAAIYGWPHVISMLKGVKNPAQAEKLLDLEGKKILSAALSIPLIMGGTYNLSKSEEPIKLSEDKMARDVTFEDLRQATIEALKESEKEKLKGALKSGLLGAGAGALGLTAIPMASKLEGKWKILSALPIIAGGLAGAAGGGMAGYRLSQYSTLKNVEEAVRQGTPSQLLQNPYTRSALKQGLKELQKTSQEPVYDLSYPRQAAIEMLGSTKEQIDTAQKREYLKGLASLGGGVGLGALGIKFLPGKWKYLSLAPAIGGVYLSGKFGQKAKALGQAEQNIERWQKVVQSAPAQALIRDPQLRALLVGGVMWKRRQRMKKQADMTKRGSDRSVPKIYAPVVRNTPKGAVVSYVDIGPVLEKTLEGRVRRSAKRSATYAGLGAVAGAAGLGGALLAGLSSLPKKYKIPLVALGAATPLVSGLYAGPKAIRSAMRARSYSSDIEALRRGHLTPRASWYAAEIARQLQNYGG